MNKEEFLEKLAYYSMEWGISGRELRAIEPATRASFCPITAVCFKEGKGEYDETDWQSAALELGLEFSLASDIVEAADDLKIDNNLSRELARACRLEHQYEEHAN